MPITKSIPGNPYANEGPYDNVGTPPTLFEGDNLQEYRAVATFSVTKIYTMSNCPGASSSNIGFIIWVADAPADSKLQYSDGTSWIPVQW